MRHKIAPDIAWQMVCGEVVLVNLSTGTALGLNGTGSLIWSLLESHDLHTVAAKIAEAFEIDTATARGDVEDFLQELSARGLLVEPC